MSQSKKILVIDDDQNFLDAVKALLNSVRYKVVTATGPKVELRKLEDLIGHIKKFLST